MHDHSETDHIVQLFDTADSLANVVSAFLKEGWDRGSALLVVARPAHWAKTADRLERRGCPVMQATLAGRLTVLDAATTLARLMRGGTIDRQLFFEHMGGIVERLAAEAHGKVRIYGEMVELLAEEGEMQEVHRLELLWNELGTLLPFLLLCGYNAAHFADAQGQDALRPICAAHSRVQQNTSDLLGNWLIAQRAQR